MSDCIFCKIASGQIPAKKVYEDHKYLAFLDVNPRARGHTLVIPKSHVITLSELPREEAGAMFQIVHYIAKTITENLNADGYNIGSNNGEMAGQAVPHLHIHIIPRYESDKHHAGFEAAFQVSEDAKKDIDKTLTEMTRGTQLAPIITAHLPAPKPKEEKKDDKNKKEPKWEFFHGEDNLESDTIEY